MLSQQINHEDTDLLGYPLVSEVYIVDNIGDLFGLLYGLEFLHSRSSSISSETIGLSNGKLLLTFKYYDYVSKTH